MAKRRHGNQGAGKPAPPPRSSWTLWSVVGAAAVVLVGVIGYLVYDAGRRPEAKPGRTAPDFTLTLFTGQGVTLSSLKGKPLLLNFWAST